MNWLGTWRRRIRIDIDYVNRIGAPVTHFPVTIFLRTGNGGTPAVFTEVGANFRRIAITQADGITELRVEVERWDSAAGVGVLHTSLAGWIINANTSLYLYFDNTQPDNPNVGGVGTTQAQAVWDANFRARWSLGEDPSGVAPQMRDSTSFANHGTTHGAMTAAQSIEGKVGRALNFDGVNDYVSIANEPNFDFERTQPFTISAWVRRPIVNAHATIISKMDMPMGARGYDLFLVASNDPTLAGRVLIHLISTWPGNAIRIDVVGRIDDGLWNHICFTYDGSSLAAGISPYINGALRTFSIHSNTLTATMLHDRPLLISSRWDVTLPFEPYQGDLDEITVATVARSAAWVRGDFNSGNDTLLTYGTAVMQVAKVFKATYDQMGFISRVFIAAKEQRNFISKITLFAKDTRNFLSKITLSAFEILGGAAAAARIKAISRDIKVRFRVKQ
jgi:hypothetical protein